MTDENFTTISKRFVVNEKFYKKVKIFRQITDLFTNDLDHISFFKLKND